MAKLSETTILFLIDSIKDARHNPEKYFEFIDDEPLDYTPEYFEIVRAIVNSVVKPSDLVPMSYAGAMARIRKLMYNPRDTGINGKDTEVRERLRLMKKNGVEFVPWSEFSAHNARRKDVRDKDGSDWEVKTTVAGGDFLRSASSDNFEYVVSCYRKRKEWIHYHNEEFGFDIFCPWPEFFDYLASYNNKGLKTWFITKASERYGETERFVFKMQVVRSSQKKLNYLRNWGK